jgi:hypothetical protein
MFQAHANKKMICAFKGKTLRFKENVETKYFNDSSISSQKFTYIEI